MRKKQLSDDHGRLLMAVKPLRVKLCMVQLAPEFHLGREDAEDRRCLSTFPMLAYVDIYNEPNNLRLDAAFLEMNVN